MEIKTIQSKQYFCFEGTTTLNEIMGVADKEVDFLYQEAQRLGIEQAGPLEFIYFDCTSDRDKPFSLEICMPIATEKEVASDKHEVHHFGDFKCVSYLHEGDLVSLGEVYGQLYGSIQAQGHKPTNQIREVYVKWENPDSPANLTEIQIGIE